MGRGFCGLFDRFRLSAYFYTPLNAEKNADSDIFPHTLRFDITLSYKVLCPGEKTAKLWWGRHSENPRWSTLWSHALCIIMAFNPTEKHRGMCCSAYPTELLVDAHKCCGNQLPAQSVGLESVSGSISLHHGTIVWYLFCRREVNDSLFLPL